MLGMVPPRSLLATRGEQELIFTDQGDLRSPEEEGGVLRWAFDYAKIFYKLYGVSEDRVEVRIFKWGHEFPKEEREYAYQWLDKVLIS
jgi:hypothetical protein